MFCHPGHQAIALEQLKQQIATPLFMEIIIFLSSSFWTTRNKFIFNGIRLSIQNMEPSFIHEFAMDSVADTLNNFSLFSQCIHIKKKKNCRGTSRDSMDLVAVGGPRTPQDPPLDPPHGYR